MCASGTCLTAGRELGVCCEAEGCATLCADDYTLRGPDGRTASCGAYSCAVDQCLQHCTNVNDCADGFVCANNVCVTPTDTPEGDGGCGCRTSPSRTPASLFFALSALLLLRRRATCSGSR